MAWTWQTALFFALLLATLLAMTVLALRRPEAERVGALGLPTTRGDRLFLSLVAAAFIHLGWIGLAGTDALWGASLLSLVVADTTFRWVCCQAARDAPSPCGLVSHGFRGLGEGPAIATRWPPKPPHRSTL